MLESDILKLVMVRASKLGDRLFRNSVAEAWIGESRHLPAGDVVIRNARRLHAGLCVGSSDLIGWRSVEITPEMVGRRVAIFVAAEGKSATGRVTEEQRRFMDAVIAAGGIAGVVRSADDYEQMVRG